MGLYNRGTVESWKASLRNARHSGNLLTIKVDELCLKLAMSGMTIADLKDNDPRLVEIRQIVPRRKDVIDHTAAEIRRKKRNERIWNLHLKGCSPKLIGNEVGISATTVLKLEKQLMREHNNAIDYTQVAIERLTKESQTVGQIALALGYNQKTITAKLNAMEHRYA
ncbi:hypothetical protein ACFQ41_10170 [Lacticaseibacillus suilingensis]|uniref:Uncharacterized protein n=1 Tax=Lacticaseibacillus suilingensis TaxID=2799577 RepID=A0ABW4BHX8_9LACO|nr:hypothetical protein [Lacticaseibacillus suilingensis]